MTSDADQVLGRYAPGPTDEELCTVRLLNFPVQLFAQAREHHDELLREFALLALRPPEDRPGHTVPRRLLDLIDTLGRRYSATGQNTDAARDAAIERGETTMDLSYDLPRSAGAALRHLHELMEEADGFCRSEQLLTLAASPLEREFRTWFIQQFVAQLDGAPPTPWSGPLRDDG